MYFESNCKDHSLTLADVSDMDNANHVHASSNNLWNQKFIKVFNKVVSRIKIQKHKQTNENDVMFLWQMQFH